MPTIARPLPVADKGRAMLLRTRSEEQAFSDQWGHFCHKFPWDNTFEGITQLARIYNPAYGTKYEPVNEPVNRSDRVLLAVGKNINLTRRQLAEQLGLSVATLRRELALLTSQNKIKRVGSDKTGHWEVVNNAE